MKIRLNVPFADNATAKEKGARWYPDKKTWYISDLKKISGVRKWIDKHNIICENLYLLKMDCKCWKCGKTTEVVLFATNMSYPKEDKYRKNTNIEILTYVTSMPTELQKFMEKYLYYPSFSSTVNKNYFINHCKHCGNTQGDNFLHEIPKDAFYKKIIYRDSEPIKYAKITNSFGIPLQANRPYYNDTINWNEMTFDHMMTGRENRSSLRVTQGKINQLFKCSIAEPDIVIHGL